MNPKKYNSLVDVITDMENVTFELDDLDHMLVVFHELLCRETSFIDRPVSTQEAVFSARFPLIESTLNVIHDRYRDVIKNLHSMVDEGLDLRARYSNENRTAEID